MFVVVLSLASHRFWRVWKRVFSLSWPVMAEQVLRTLMRTTDLIVAGLFSPAAVAAVGLADIYARFPLRFGIGIGDGAIALSSQDTGADADANRNQAVTQALLIGLLGGIPFILFGLFLNEYAIAILGSLAEEGAMADVIEYGSTYLMIIMVSAPAIHVNFIAARSIHGTGDTRTPMYVNGVVNALNIVATIGLALGLGPFPELGVVGIALATAVSDTLGALTFLLILWSPLNEIQYVVPRQLVITKQLILISWPRIAEGLTEMFAEFPFNAILLAFGTEVNAAYHIGRRMYQQVASPLARGYGVAANIMVGQSLGRGEPKTAFYNGAAATALSTLTVGGFCLLLFFFAEQFVLVFTDDPATVGYASGFAQAYAIAAVLIAAYLTLAGSLRGGSETVPPFIARVIGTFVFLLGFTYVFGVVLEYGVVAAYVAVVLDFVFRVAYLGVVFYRRRWIDRGTSMMRERGSIEENPAED
ncbi:MATE family efflux transporter [Halostagnicola sp. A-GB9-2]|uniref:MATE family efflux transporter n=1 Tax=Halostagnicola sp. A-GB9-2 TaxID=3048066 RepID=UPI0024C08DC2|nr:MATE family efflux transporter [Halostagnicola sp. A-GB9-2]MDJ1431899.1 MATE family efflux transporter [Halostagnicola sp. A-GB9-2]